MLKFCLAIVLLCSGSWAMKWRVERDLDEFTSDESVDIQDVRADEPSSTASSGLTNLRQMIERGFADWRAYKERHGWRNE